jgi:hypothetical protein
LDFLLFSWLVFCQEVIFSKANNMKSQSGKDYKLWGDQLARLLELIASTSEIIKEHRLHNSPDSYIADYESLLQQYKGELSLLGTKMGFDIKLSSLEAA